MVRRIGFILFAMCLLAALPSHSFAELDAQAEQLARWQLNNADLLIDEGKYMQAVEYIDSAYEMSRYHKTRSDALLSRAMVMATFLDAPEQAVATYKRLAKEYPAFGEVALYQSAFIQLQTGNQKEAQAGFRDYLKKYPNGRFRFQSEAMLETIDIPTKPAAPVKPKPVPPVKPVQPVEPDVVGESPELRILLGKKATSVVLQGQGANVCVDGVGCASGINVGIKNGKPTLNGKPVNTTSLDIRSQRPIKVSVKKNKKRVRGYVKVKISKGRLMVVNYIPIEDYLRSVVPAESYASWPMNTLKAQAIAARTYAYYQKLHRESWSYDLRADTYDQMYGGVDRENKRTDRAVRETAGMVLTHKGKPIFSQYTANSGGYTADAGAVFGAPKPYLVSHSDPASLKGKMASWKRTYTTDEIVRALKKIGVDVHGLRAIQPAIQGPSGRLVKVRLVHAKGTTVVRTRTTLASSRVLKLPEVLFSVEKQGDRYIFRGRGHGHGVGYSQWGSAELGKTMNYDRILAFYYPKTNVDVLWK